MDGINPDSVLPTDRSSFRRSSLDEALAPGTRPRTTTVFIWLTVAAVIVSYLFAYAFTNALVASELIQRWPREHDPRPRWMLFAFAGMWSIFVAAGVGMRWISRRQLQSIDAMSGEAE